MITSVLHITKQWNIRKYFLVSIFLLLFGFFWATIHLKSEAAVKCPKNTIFVCKEEVEKMIADAIAPLQAAITSLTGRTTALEATDTNQNTQITDLQNQVTGLGQSNASLSAAVSDLQTRVTKLEATPSPSLSPSPTPVPVTIQIATSEQAPASHTFTIPPGYKTMTFHVSSTASVVAWAVGVSFDNGITYHEEQRFGCNQQTCPDDTVPILSDHANFGTGSSTGNVTASVTFNPEPTDQILTLGQIVSYPFTSPSFLTDGFSTITITQGGGDNPQHVTGLSLQRFESGSFVEKQFIACDGGDMCPVQSLPLLGGTYQVVMQGSGTGAVMGAILRK